MSKKTPYFIFLLKSGLLFFALLFSNSLFAQTPFWTETFDGSVCLAGSGCDPSLVAWNRVSLGGEGGSPNRFYVSCQENGNAAGTCGSGCGSNQTLHIGNVSTSSAAALFCPAGDCGAAYDATGAGEVTNTRCESPVISSAGLSGISVNFNYIEGGQTTLDNATLWYFDGTTWAQVDDMPKSVNTGCSGQGKWTARTVGLPVSANNNANMQIGFKWENNGDGSGSDPSFAVNDVVLTYTLILPVKLIAFDALWNSENNVELKWITESEINNDYFTVERSFDGINFEGILNLPGSGNSNSTLHYSAVDSNPLSGISYYRIKQTDQNGEFSYSPIKSVSSLGEITDQTLVYPNPSSDFIHVITKKKDPQKMKTDIMDLRGAIIYSETALESNQITIDISMLPSSVYIIESNIDGVVSRKKIVKK